MTQVVNVQASDIYVSAETELSEAHLGQVIVSYSRIFLLSYTGAIHLCCALIVCIIAVHWSPPCPPARPLPLPSTAITM